MDKLTKYSIQIDLTDNEMIWDSIDAYSVRHAVKIFKRIYSQLERHKDEDLDKYIYEDLNNHKTTWKDYLPESQRTTK